MSSVNSVIIVGKVSSGESPRVDTANQKMFGFTVECKETFTGKDGKPGFRTEWVPVKCWGRLAESVMPMAMELYGSIVAVHGKLRTESWVAADGAKKYKTVVNADSVNIIAPGQPQEAPAADESPDYFGT